MIECFTFYQLNPLDWLKNWFNILPVRISTYLHLFIPPRPYGIDEVNGQNESAQAEQDPEDSLCPVAAVLSDVAEAVQGAESVR